MQTKSLFAAIDLGSNSFRLEIGRIEHGEFIRTEYLKETVRQGGGLDEERNLTPAAMQAGWDCLARFGERLAGFKRPKTIDFTAELPRDPNGKLYKRKLRDPYWAGRDARI